MTQEEKARAYDKALEIAKKNYDAAQDLCSGSQIGVERFKKTLTYIFPELKESENEKIRKAIRIYLDWLDGHKDYQPKGDYTIKDMLAWLEKQGEQKPVLEMKTPEESLGLDSETYNEIVNDCIFGENKPKFNVGDWIKHNKANFIFQINKVTTKNYEFNNPDGYNHSLPIKSVDEKYHLWTIADAKEGDVLAINWHEGDNSWEKIIIFKKYYNKGVEGLINAPCVEGYGNTFKNGKLAITEEVPYYSKTWTCNLHPATKEQRELLFQKMREAGYEWDADKKELKIIDWCKQIKYNLNPPSIIEESTWSEEDSKRLQRIIDFLWHNRKGDTDEIYQQEQDVNWLKSIKPQKQWKPTKEQMDALLFVVQHYTPNVTDKLAWDSIKILELMYYEIK